MDPEPSLGYYRITATSTLKPPLDYASLLDIAKHLLAEGEPDRTAETILRRVVDFSGADRGFIVVREGKSYEEKFAVRFDAGSGSRLDRRVSRSLVRT